MRKRTIKFGLDNLFWYIIYLLPIIMTLVQSIGIFKNFTLDDWRFILSERPIYLYDFMDLLNENLLVLGFDGTLPDAFWSLINFFEDNSWYSSNVGPILFNYLWYFVFCNIAHLMIDFILFIPRLAHKWMNTFTQTED